MHFLCVALLLITPAATTQKKNDQSKSGFFYTMPKTLVSSKNETICLSIHSSSPTAAPSKLTVDLKLGHNHHVTTRMMDSEHSCFEIRVPVHTKSQPQTVNIRVQVAMNGVTYSAFNQDPVVIYPKKKYVLVDTDRNMYKSEDVVKLRLLLLKENLLPEGIPGLSYVRMVNPVGMTVAVWKNVTAELGLVHLEHQLSRDSIPGKWKIEADGETKKTFEVNKYVIPRFKVLVSHPKTIYYKAPSVAIKVCAKYSYGATVRGTAFVRLSDSHNHVKTVQALKKMSDGCSDFTFHQNELLLAQIRRTDDSKISILITATVTEDGTDKIELTTTRSLISFQLFSVKFARIESFLPGLTYHGAVVLGNVHGVLNEEVVEICYNVAINKSWNYVDNEQCSNSTIGDKRTIHFRVPPLKASVVHFQLNARAVGHEEIHDELLVVRVYSPSSSYITVEEVQPAEKSCRPAQQFSLEYTTSNMREGENVTFFYMIKSSNRIYKMQKLTRTVQSTVSISTNNTQETVGLNHRHTKLDVPSDKFTFKVRLDSKIISNYQLLVYYLTNKGEIVSTVKEVKMGICLSNEVKANWSHRQIVPGGTASLLLETKSDSLCSVATVDKATTFISGVGGATSVKGLVAPFLEERESPQSRRKACVAPTKRNKNAPAFEEKETRKKRYIYSFSEDYDAFDVFNKLGIVTITNFKIVTKPCYVGPPPSAENAVEFLTDQYDIQGENSATLVRSYFPETWLWELIPVRNAAVIHRDIPHSITTWTTSVICVSATDGTGVSSHSEITTFQPFFVQVLTPYSVKKKETLYLHAIVFNYLTYNIPIRIGLEVSQGLSFIDPMHKRSFSYCVLSNNTVTHVFELRAVKVEKVNVTLAAELDSSYPGECGPDILINKRDVVFKTFLVEPEGYPVQHTKSALLCSSSGSNQTVVTDYNSLNNISWRLESPKNTVPHTLKSELLFSGDILGQAVTNLDELIVMPTGCGEQIMSTLAPNLYVLRYLNETKILSSMLKHRILRHLKIGYQRILNYVHKDGSFSAFGYHDPAGSMFLTAFVVRTLQDAKRHVYVDQRVIDRATSWIMEHQLENGCFSTMLHVFQDMGGTSFENSTAGLTAYVVISLLSGSSGSIPESVLTNAKYCIRGHNHLDKYTLAISAYALLKIEWISEAERMLKKLMEVANQKDNMMWWSNKEPNGSLASDIETTSYVLLALLHKKSQDNLAKAHSIVRWLTAQQGPHGGFQTTQDTVVALDALTQYSHLVNYQLVDLHVGVSTEQRKHHFTLTNDDRIKSRKIVLGKNDTNVSVRVEGDGCVLAQHVQTYYIEYVTTSDSFKLNAEVLPLSKRDQCSIVSISSCFSYTGADLLSNMAILEVDLPSGYQADRSSLYKLVEDPTTSVKMFEETAQKIVLYVTKLTSRPICTNFVIMENVIVQSRANYTIKLYDYYKPEFHVFQFYKMNDTCRSHDSAV